MALFPKTHGVRNTQVSSVTQSCPTLCNPMACSTPGLPVHDQLPEFTQTHVHRVGNGIQPSHPLSTPSPAFHLSQYQGLFQWVSSLHQVAKVRNRGIYNSSRQVYLIGRYFKSGFPNLRHLMPDDLRCSRWNTNWNKAHSNCTCLNLLSTIPAPSTPPPPQAVGKLFHESSPWCQKVWGPLF